MPVSGELFDIRARFALGEATAVGLQIGDDRIVYDVKQNKLQDADLSPIQVKNASPTEPGDDSPAGGEIEIRVLVDRPMLEIIGNQGRVYITARRDKPGNLTAVRAFAEGRGARVILLEARKLRSIWRNQ